MAGSATPLALKCRKLSNSGAWMPGYRALADFLTGPAAEYTRLATLREEEGDLQGALVAFRAALRESLAVRPELPGFVCGRLAALYRKLECYEDEVELLERYRDSQTQEEARTRFDARISKAQAIANRKSRRDSGALASVRAIKPSRSAMARSAAARNAGAMLQQSAEA